MKASFQDFQAQLKKREDEIQVEKDYTIAQMKRKDDEFRAAFEDHISQIKKKDEEMK